jgi:phosphatidylserine decarboxylase
MGTSIIDRVFQQEDINFLLTNRIPRRLATTFIGWFSQIEQPLVRDLSMGCLRLAGPESHEGKKAQCASLQDCFIHELSGGVPSTAPPMLVSP